MNDVRTYFLFIFVTALLARQWQHIQQERCIIKAKDKQEVLKCIGRDE